MTYVPYPRAMFRKAENGHDCGDGILCAVRTVEDADEEAAAKKDGWFNSPAEADAGTSAKAAAKTDPFDHDGNGAPGGSLPKAKRAPAKKKARK